MESNKRPFYLEFDGFRLSDGFVPEEFRSATKFKPTSDDVIVATYPKCGTTWMCQIVKLIQTKGEHSKLNAEEYFSTFPFLELFGAKRALERRKPGCIKTHLPFDRVNFSEEAKYIYVTRHPRDCVVSYYHHTKYFPEYRFSDGSFDVFFNLFIQGMVDFNDYFDHLLSWYEQRHRPNILFLTYESMKSDHLGTVLKVANFLGYSLTEQELDNIIKYSSFDYMKTETNDVYSHFSDAITTDEIGMTIMNATSKAMEEGHQPVGDFIRKGVVGEGKLVLSKEQDDKLKARILEKTKGSDVMSLWSDM